VLGVALGLGFTACFGLGSMIIRRAVLRASARYVTSISVFIGPPFFLLVASFSGELLKLGQFPWQVHAFFAVSGVMHFALGRNCANRAIQLIGATRSSIVTGLKAIVGIVLAVTILKETLTLFMGLGVVLALLGPALMLGKELAVTSNTESGALSHVTELDRHSLYKGMLYAVSAAVLWGSSSVFIKLALENGGSSVVGTLIAYLAASVAIGPSILLSRSTNKEMTTMDGRSLRLALLGGLTINIAQMLRYLALAHTTVIVISVMTQTTPLWVLLFAFIFNRRIESFSRWVLLGSALLIIGTTMVVVS